MIAMTVLNYVDYVGFEEIAKPMESAYKHLIAARKEEGQEELRTAIEQSKKLNTEIAPCALMKLVYDDVISNMTSEIQQLGESVFDTKLRAPTPEDTSTYAELGSKATLLSEYTFILNSLCMQPKSVG
ncbi:MAG: hypothetical protein KAJ91_02145 [Candidatus Aenigmarchaeota archaeon]|nr:hypothetical protein [Candidatus Aenigmarchaeota archaeon]MCK5333652.1 hypothetical protein [Candidatus Aenigmarchaeota archaeon]